MGKSLINKMIISIQTQIKVEAEWQTAELKTGERSMARTLVYDLSRHTARSAARGRLRQQRHSCFFSRPKVLEGPLAGPRAVANSGCSWANKKGQTNPSSSWWCLVTDTDNGQNQQNKVNNSKFQSQKTYIHFTIFSCFFFC